MALSLAILEGLSIPEYVKEAARVFSHDEIESLGAFFDDRTNEFIGLGFVNEHGKFAQYADPTRAGAIIILESYYRTELSTRQRISTDSALNRMSEVQP